MAEQNKPKRGVFAQFAGVNASVEEHRLAPGEVPYALNLMMRSGSLRNRPGFRRIRDYTGNIGPLGVEQWPGLLIGFIPENIPNVLAPAEGAESAGDLDDILLPESTVGSELTASEPDEDNSAITMPVPPDAGETLLPNHDTPDEEGSIALALPGTVYSHCQFDIKATSDDCDGTGCALVVKTTDGTTVQAATLLETPTVTSGWSENAWSGVAAIDDDGTNTLVWAQITKDGYKSLSGTAALLMPTFGVTLAQTAGTATLTVGISCNQANYVGDGDGLSLTWERWNGSEWVSWSVTGEGSLTSGWSGGAWSDTVTADDPSGSTLVRVVLSYDGRGETLTDEAELTLDVAETLTVNIVPEKVKTDVAFALTLTWLDAWGNAYAADGTGVTLEAETSEAGSPPWVEMGTSGGDLSSGWSNGVWSGTLTVLGDEASYADNTLKVTAVKAGADLDSDTAIIDFDYDQHVIDAILERQKAANIDSGDWLDAEGTYSLAQLITATNQLAAGVYGDSFTDPDGYELPSGTNAVDELADATWVGITASGATNIVDDTEELFAVVVTLTYTTKTKTVVSRPYGEARADALDPEYPWASPAAAWEAVLACWPEDETPHASGNAKVVVVVSDSGGSGDWHARFFKYALTWSVSGLTTEVEKTAHLYFLADNDSSYDYGLQSVNGNWYLANSTSLGSATSGETAAYPTTGYGPPSTGPENLNLTLTFEATNAFFVVEWSFTY